MHPSERGAIFAPGSNDAGDVGAGGGRGNEEEMLAASAKVWLKTYHEGPAAQIMHLGPYSAEGPTVARLHACIAEHGYSLSGKHHEIYLSDPRKSAPEKNENRHSATVSNRMIDH
ncbi:MAG: GyrI-like domain-containing protein [Candidatus Promineifilaceae bacterium]